MDGEDAWTRRRNGSGKGRGRLKGWLKDAAIVRVRKLNFFTRPLPTVDVEYEVAQVALDLERGSKKDRESGSAHAADHQPNRHGGSSGANGSGEERQTHLFVHWGTSSVAMSAGEPDLLADKLATRYRAWQAIEPAVRNTRPPHTAQSASAGGDAAKVGHSQSQSQSDQAGDAPQTPPPARGVDTEGKKKARSTWRKLSMAFRSGGKNALGLKSGHKKGLPGLERVEEGGGGRRRQEGRRAGREAGREAGKEGEGESRAASSGHRGVGARGLSGRPQAPLRKARSVGDSEYRQLQKLPQLWFHVHLAPFDKNRASMNNNMVWDEASGFSTRVGAARKGSTRSNARSRSSTDGGGGKNRAGRSPSAMTMEQSGDRSRDMYVYQLVLVKLYFVLFEFLVFNCYSVFQIPIGMNSRFYSNMTFPR